MVSTGWRSQRFQDLVEGTPTGSGRTSSYDDLLDVVGALRMVPAPAADPAFVASLRERLLEEATTVLVTPPAEQAKAGEQHHATPPRTRRRNRRLAAALSGVVVVAGSATMAVAAQTALPGEGLYPLKRGLESAHARLTFDDGARGRVLLASASTRLDEAAQLSRRGGSADEVGQTLDAFTQEAVSGSDLLVADYQATGDQSSMTTIRTFTAASTARLRELRGLVPPGAFYQLLQAAQAVDQVQQVSAHACPGCPGPSVTEMPSVLAQAAQAAAEASRLLPSPHQEAPSHHQPRQTHAGSRQPSGSPGDARPPRVGSNPTAGSVIDPSQAGPDRQGPLANDVEHTVQHLTHRVTRHQHEDVGSTVTDTAGDVLDAAGDAANQLAGTVDGTVGSLGSPLPTDLPSLP